MKAIYKYPVGKKIEMPVGAKVLYANYGGSDDNLNLWAEVDPEQEMTETRFFAAVPTGAKIPDTYVYVSTVFPTEYFVWHVYEIIE